MGVFTVSGNVILNIGPSNSGTAQKTLSAALMLLAGFIAMPAAAQDRVPFDRPTPVNGIEVVYTGIGSGARDDPRWQTYPFKVEVAGADSQLLGNVAVAFEREGQTLVHVACGGPWVLARLSPGVYTITATYEGLSTSSPVNVPMEGQGRVILRFPEAGGKVSPEYEIAPN